MLATTALAGALSLGVVPSSSFALPAGGQVAAGQATIASVANTLSVNQTSSSAIINWQSFNIASGEQVQFHQPTASSITLNRVTGGQEALIEGSLTANGKVWIIDPNGVFIGSNAQVNVGGMLVTTANIRNANFMAGNYAFDRPGNPNASISNAGNITVADAGMVAFVAPSVANNGVINARLGKVTLASGDTFVLDTYGDGLVNLAVSPQVTQQLVNNNGIIQANGGTITLTAAAGPQIVNSLINNSGIISAESAGVGQNGEIILYAQGSNAVPNNVVANKGQTPGTSTVVNSGVLDASGYGTGQTGGSISVLGDNVAILSGSYLDASGDIGGGTIKIGGDFHGAGITPTALNTYVDANALIMANANTSGNGGNVAVWSDNNTWFNGNIMAEGGVKSGNGGFVETSGHGTLTADGNVDLLALNGNKGTYLLDPTNISIYGGVTPAFNSSSGVTDGTQVSLSSTLQLWLDASNTSNVTLTYNSLGVTATGTSGTYTVTTNSDISSTLYQGERIRLGGAGSVTAASTLGADTYTISSFSGTTIVLSSPLTTNYSGSGTYGGYVSQINDLSGNGNNATQATAGSMPLWISNGQNGIGSARFNGGSDYLNVTYTNSALETVFVVAMASNPTASYERILAGNNNTGNVDYSHGTFTAGSTLYSGSAFGAAFSTASLNVLTAIYNGASSQILDNNVLKATGNPGSNAASTVFSIGANTGGGGQGLVGDIAELPIYNTNLSTNAQALVNQYESAKWGVALTGPGNATGEAGLTGAEAQSAMASTQAGATTDGYSVFAASYLNRLSQSSNIILQASNNINLDLQVCPLHNLCRFFRSNR